MSTDALDKLLKENPALYKALMAQVACEKSLYKFTETMWEFVEPANKFIGNWHLEALAAHLEAVTDGHITRLLINVPPGTMKSLMTNVFWPAWEWINQPHLRYISTSYSAGLTERDNIRFRQVITSDLYQAMWGDKFGFSRDSFNVTKIGNNKTGWKIATSTEGMGTGERGNRILCVLTTTVILTDMGLISMGEIVDKKLNIRVAGYDGENVVWQQIETWQKNPFRPLIKIHFNGGVFICTEGHRICTQRGDIPAEEIREGDKVYSFCGEDMSSLPKSYFQQALPGGGKDLLQQEVQVHRGGDKSNICQQQAVYQMLKDYIQTSGSPRKNTERNILQSQMPRRMESEGEKSGMERREENKNLSTVQKKFYSGDEKQQENSKILFIAVFRSFSEASVQRMSILLKGISSSKSVCGVLLKNLCRNISWKKDFRGEKSKICPWGCEQNIPEGMDREIQAHNKEKGQASLCEVRDDKEKTQRDTSCPSHQLYESGFRPDESDNALQILPLKASRWSGTKRNLEERDVISVERISNQHEATYNVSVAPCHNYFADGILVKNCDDPHNVKDGESDAVRKSTLQYFSEVLPTRVTDPISSAIAVIMQRVHDEDVSGYILSKELGYTHLMLPMEFEPDRKCFTFLPSKSGPDDPPFFEDPRTEPGELLFPARMPDWVVERDKKILGPYAVAGQFQQSPVPRGGGIIKREYWKLYPEDGVESLTVANPKLEYPVMDYIIASTDTAYSAKTEADFNALAILGLWRKLGVPKIMLMHCWKRRLDFRGEILPRLPDETDAEYQRRRKKGWGMLEWTSYECQRWGVDKLLIEGKATGMTLAQEIRKVYSDSPWATQLINPRGDKVARVYAIQHIFAEGMVYAPERQWAEEAITEMQYFPKGAHDDLTDCITQGIRYLRDSGWALRREEVKAEDTARTKYRPRMGAIYDV